MGWVDSPNFLRALTETITDMTNHRTAALELATSASLGCGSKHSATTNGTTYGQPTVQRTAPTHHPKSGPRQATTHLHRRLYGRLSHGDPTLGATSSAQHSIRMH
jgi:hypothetical protein